MYKLLTALVYPWMTDVYYCHQKINSMPTHTRGKAEVQLLLLIPIVGNGAARLFFLLNDPLEGSASPKNKKLRQSNQLL